MKVSGSGSSFSPGDMRVAWGCLGQLSQLSVSPAPGRVRCLSPVPHPSSSPTGWTGCQQKSRSRGAKLAVTNPQGLKHAAYCRGKPEAGSFEASRGFWFPGRQLEPSRGQKQSWWYMWAGPRRSPAPNFLDTNGGLPLLSPYKRFPPLSLLFCHFPHSSPFGKFYSPLRLHFTMAGNARAQLGHKYVGWGEVRTGRVRGDPLWLGKGR